MNTNIIEFLNSRELSNISYSLEQISKYGIPIKDTFAPVTTLVNFGTTMLATLFGGLLTIQLYKAQEKIRIREDLRLSFYKEYREKYTDLYESILDLNESIKSHKKFWNKKLMYIADPIIGIYGLKVWNCYYPQQTNTDYINKIKHIYAKSEILNKFLQRNKNIFTLNTIYNHTNNKIKEIRSVYVELEMAYRATKGNDDELRKNLNNIDEFTENLNLQTPGLESLKYDKDSAKNHLIRVEKLCEEYKEQNVKRHNELIPRVLNFDSEIDKILEEINDMNEIIECEYINKYLK